MNVFEEGKVLLIDKPFEWTSFDVVRKIRSILRIKKVGHAGTLDPLATGLLILCTGRYTKKINEYMAREKEYTGSFTIGATTPTYDLESIPENFRDIGSITEKQITDATIPLTGEILQMPPIHSPIKKEGRRLYEHARAGRVVEVEPRPVTIEQFEITAIQLPKIFFRIVCTTGTYIRSMAFDYGNILGTGAYLSELRRTRIGEFSVDDAMNLEEAERMIRETYAQNG